MLKVSRAGLPRLKEVVRELRARADFDTLDIPHMINALLARGAAIEVQYVHGHWRGVNDLEDCAGPLFVRMLSGNSASPRRRKPRRRRDHDRSA